MVRPKPDRTLDLGRRGATRGALNRLTSPWAILALGIGVRAVLLAKMAEPSDIWCGDPETYVKVQDALRRGVLIPRAWIWPPGYPLLAIPLSWIFGAGASLVIVSFVAGAALPALPMIAGKLAGLPLRGKLAALVIAVHPEAALASARPLSESPALFLAIATVVALEIACRKDAPRWGAAAGALGGLAVLTRPEFVLTIALLGVFVLTSRTLATHRRVLLVATFGALAALFVLPYLIALHNASGRWALSLKLHYNVEKCTVYQEGKDFVDKRLRWERFLEEKVLDDGEIDPRRLVAVSRVRRWMLHREMPGFWMSNVVSGFARDPWMINVLWIAGVLGLAFPGRRPRREALLAAISGASLLAVPLLFTPVERYALVALPAFAWGTATVIERLSGRLSSPRWRQVALAIALGAAIAGGVWGSLRGARNSHWTGRSGEFHVAMGRQDFAAAERHILDALRVDPENAEVHEALAGLRFQQGDLAGAERALLEAGRCGADPAETAAALRHIRDLQR
jgi:hypothetical protein